MPAWRLQHWPTLKHYWIKDSRLLGLWRGSETAGVDLILQDSSLLGPTNNAKYGKI